MKDCRRLARVHVTTALRERVTFFWYLVFPLFLLVILTLIFSNIGSVGDLTLPIGLVNQETPSATADFATIIEDVFLSLSQAGTASQTTLFDLRSPDPTHDASAPSESQLNAVRNGDITALLLIPEGFNQDVLKAVTTDSGPATLTVYLSGGRSSSELAESVIEQVIAGLDEQILTTLGRFDPLSTFAVEHRTIAAADDEPFQYVDFLLPGILLMGFFTTGLFGVPGTILFGRDRGILRRYWVTPLTVPRYLAGFSMGHGALCLLQFVCLWLVGRFALGATVVIFRPLPLLFLVLGAVTFLAFGFFVASVARTANAGMAIANILNMPMMFLGGLFFPIGDLPLALRAVMYVNPMTYLADGLRGTLGIDVAMFPLPVALAVPAAWTLVCIVVAGSRLRWGVER